MKGIEKAEISWNDQGGKTDFVIVQGKKDDEAPITNAVIKLLDG